MFAFAFDLRLFKTRPPLSTYFLHLFSLPILALASALCLPTLCNAAESLCAAFDRKTGLSGSEYWAGLKRHPAVVNPVGRAPSPDVMSLTGEWEFTTFKLLRKFRKDGKAPTTLDMYTPLVPYAETAHFARDGVHPEGGAQRVIAEITAKAIREL